MRRNNIGILTWHDPTNCGSALQAYALHYYLRQLGYDAEIIRYVPQWCRHDYMQMPIKTLSKRNKVKRIVKDFLLPIYYRLPEKRKKCINPFFPFYYRYCKMTPACTEQTVAKCSKSFSTIISGSDQVWNPNFIDPIFLQSFVNWDVHQISYAASLGGRDMLPEYVGLYQKCLSRFSAISVREEEGKEMLESIGVDAEVHIDPTLLLDAKHYRSIAKRVNGIDKPFVFCYFLPTDREYKTYVQNYIKKHNIEAVGFSHNKDDYNWIKPVSQMGPCEWLWLVDNAELVLTNSYHASIFSLILHTPFYTFVRFMPNDPVCQNSRLEQLNAYFDITDYLIENEIPERDCYPFSRFENLLPGLRQKAKDYLLKNIQ